MPAAPVPPHPSQPLHLARRPASPVAPPTGAENIGQAGSKPTANPHRKKGAKKGKGAETRKVVQTDIKHLNVYDVLNADKVVIEESALAYINDFYGESGAAWA